MHEQVLLSVVTVTWNAGRILPETLRSVRENIASALETYSPGLIEYILVDGGSGDGTVDLIRTAHLEGLVQNWVSEPDRGIYDAMNKAVAMAKGSWVIFMNAGDVFAHGNVLAQVLPQLSRGPGEGQVHAHLVYGDCFMEMSDGRVVYDIARGPEEIRNRMICSHQSLFAHRELLLQFPFDIGFRVAADHYFLLQVLAKGVVSVRLDFPIARVRLENYSLGQILAGHQEKYIAVRRVFPGLATNGYFTIRWFRLVIAALLKGLLKRVHRPLGPVRYLFRLDDACPHMKSEPWQRLEALFDSFAVNPLVAIIPDCKDPELLAYPLCADFWPHARAWAAKGWAIALHGHEHILRDSSPGLVPLNRYSEFTDLPLDLQRTKLVSALALLQEQGLEPRWWVAPAHGFDSATLQALQELSSIRHLSDGLTRRPFTQAGFVWVPQQLWRPRTLRSGTWTVCLHPNDMVDEDFTALEAFLLANRASLGTWNDMLALVPGAVDLPKRTMGDWLFGQAFLVARGMKRMLRSWMRLRRGSPL